MTDEAELHILHEGEHIAQIAARYGFRDPKTILDHPDNQKLNQGGRDPQLLMQGVGAQESSDELTIPPMETEMRPAEVEKWNTYLVKSAPTFLRLRILDATFEPVRTTDYTLIVGKRDAPGSKTLTGKTDDKGRLEVEIPPDAREGTLTMRIRTLAPEGKKKEDGEAPVAGDALMVWELDLQTINPVMDESRHAVISGVQRRLTNLGLYDGECNGELTKKTRDAIKLFQRLAGVPKGDGNPDAATCDRLKNIHDSYAGETTLSAKKVKD